LKSTYRENKQIRERLSVENLERNIKAGLSLRDALMIPLEKGTNRIYFSAQDNVSQKRLRKLDTIEIKK